MKCGQKISMNRLLSLGCKSQIEVCNVLFEDVGMDVGHAICACISHVIA